jgi:hypothetical protein
MRFLANENFPLAAVDALREASHDTACVREEAPGSTDEAVLDWAVREGRVLLTFDKDFGALVFRSGASASGGVVLFRVVMQPDAACLHPKPRKGGRHQRAGRSCANGLWQGSRASS